MKKHRNAICIFASVLILILLAFYINNSASRNIVKSENSYTVSIDGTYLSDPLHVICTITESIEDNTRFVKYDMQLFNDMNTTLSNWKALINLEDDEVIKSYEEVQISKITLSEDNSYFVIPGTDIMDIPGKKSVSFSFTIAYPLAKAVKFNDFNVYGNIYDDHIYNVVNVILLLALLLWIFHVFIYIYKNFNYQEYRKRREMDEQIILQAIDTFVRFIDAKDTYTRGHSKRVAMYSREIASRMKLSEDTIQNLYYVALLHDVGKISIPDTVLNKPGKLTQEEREIIQGHTIAGGNMLKKFTSIQGVREGALYHHERYDGKGYPEGLKGTDIPLYARIICVADSYDAMSSSRIYRRHMNRDEIIEELKNCSGTQFDPKIVRYMIDMVMDGYVNIVKTEVAKDDEDFKKY